MFLNLIINQFNPLLTDAPTPWGLYFQDGASPSFEGIVELHDQIMFYLVVILFGVAWILGSSMKTFSSKQTQIVYKYSNHGTLIELIWTISPALVLVAIAFPSFKLLYLMDDVLDPAMTVKAVGFLNGGPKSHVKNKIKDTSKENFGSQKNIFFKNNSGLISSNIHKRATVLRPFERSGLYFLRSFKDRVRSINRIGPHNCDVVSVITGLMLGDGYAHLRTGEGVRICIRQGLIHKEYLFSLYKFFLERGYCSKLEPRQYSRKLKRLGPLKDEEKTYYGYEFNLYTFRSLNWVHKLFYKDGKKIVPIDLINLLTPLALAVWISDDGGWTKAGVRIATNSFQLNEVIYLRNILESKYQLDATIQKISLEGKYSIYIKKNSIKKLEEIILVHLDKSMYYKLGL